MLPLVDKEDELAKVSSRGYALGYIGGGMLLLINAVMIFVGPGLLPNMPAQEATALMMRLSLLSVAIWWAVFSIPLFRHVSEPPARGESREVGQNVITVGFQRVFTAL